MIEGSGEGARIPPLKVTFSDSWSDFAPALTDKWVWGSGSPSSPILCKLLSSWSSEAFGGGRKLIAVHRPETQSVGRLMGMLRKPWAKAVEGYEPVTLGVRTAMQKEASSFVVVSGGGPMNVLTARDMQLPLHRPSSLTISVDSPVVAGCLRASWSSSQRRCPIELRQSERWITRYPAKDREFALRLEIWFTSSWKCVGNKMPRIRERQARYRWPTNRAISPSTSTDL
jgi:hypothetical protein